MEAINTPMDKIYIRFYIKSDNDFSKPYAQILDIKNIEYKSKPKELYIYDIHGILIKSINITDNNEKEELDKLKELSTDKKEFIIEYPIEKFIINKIIFNSNNKKIILLDANRNIKQIFDSNIKLEHTVDINIFKNFFYTERIAAPPYNTSFYLKIFLTKNIKCYPKIDFYDRLNNKIDIIDMKEVFDIDNKILIEYKPEFVDYILDVVPNNTLYIYAKLKDDKLISTIKTTKLLNCDGTLNIDIIHNGSNQVIYTLTLPNETKTYNMSYLYTILLVYRYWYIVVIIIIIILLCITLSILCAIRNFS